MLSNLSGHYRPQAMGSDVALAIRCNKTRGRGTALIFGDGKSPRIRSVHQGNVASDLTPLELPLEARAAILPRLQLLFPLEEFVDEAEMRLDDDVEPARADKTVGSRKRETQLSHDLGDADCGAPGDAHTAVDQGGGAISSSAV